MKKHWILSGLALVFFSKTSLCQTSELHGTVKLDTSWQKKVYISRIPDFNQMFTASNALIIAQSEIDSNGNFSINFPGDSIEKLYRLHFIKKGDPVSTLIIGSKDANHIFFIAANNDHIIYQQDNAALNNTQQANINQPNISVIQKANATNIQQLNTRGTQQTNINQQPNISGMQKENTAIIQQSNISGNRATAELNILMEIIHSDSLPRDSIKNKLISLADTSSSELVSLLAIYNEFGLTREQKNKVKEIVKKLDKSNPYAGIIFEEYNSSSNIILLSAILALLLLTTVTVAYTLLNKRRRTKMQQLLSQREIKIASLILSGKSNKEIATELSIELSTVKTHVNNIYSKLKISSRKELQKHRDLLSI